MKDILNLEKTKYAIKMSTVFKKQLRKAVKQGKDISKLEDLLGILANGEELGERYHNHQLKDDKYYKGCSECHIAPNWVLIYYFVKEELILVLMNIGSHSEVFPANY